MHVWASLAVALSSLPGLYDWRCTCYEPPGFPLSWGVSPHSAACSGLRWHGGRHASYRFESCCLPPGSNCSQPSATSHHEGQFCCRLPARRGAGPARCGSSDLGAGAHNLVSRQQAPGGLVPEDGHRLCRSKLLKSAPSTHRCSGTSVRTCHGLLACQSVGRRCEVRGSARE